MNAAIVSICNAEPVEAPWYVVLVATQQDLQTVWRFHALGLELYVPLLRRRVKTGRVHNGVKLTRIIARPMFPGYGFLRQTDPMRVPDISAVRGVYDYYRDPIDKKHRLLPHAAVMVVRNKERDEHSSWLATSMRGRRYVPFKRGDRVKLDVEGSAYAGLIGQIERIDSKRRIEILFGNLVHKVPADMVVLA
jgi:hypothetical protein